LLGAFRTDSPPDDPDLAPFRRHLARLVPQWRSGGNEQAGPATQLDAANDLVLAEGVVRLLRTLGGRTGCLLVLEDLHWADEDTLAALEYLADNLATEHVLCLATVRRGEHSAAERRVHQLAARRAATVLDLAPLTADEVQLMSAACLRLPRLPPRFGQSVADRADGVPFLVEELLAGLAARGIVRRELDHWDVPDEAAAAVIVPVSFAETVLSRLESLGPSARQVLNAAAVLGRRFDWSLLPSISGMEQDAVTRALSGAVDAQLLTAAEGFSFRHALTRDAVIAHLLPPDRVELSRRALDALVAAHPDLPGRWCDLAAELAEQAGDRHRAATSLLQAGRRAFNDGGLIIAQTVLERARGHALDDPMLLDNIDDSLTEVLAHAGQVERAIEVGEPLIARLAARPDANRILARVHLCLARAAVAAGAWPTATEHVELARTQATRDTDAELSARVEVLAAQVAMGERKLGQAAEHAHLALAAAEPAGPADVVCEAFEILGRQARQSDLVQAETYFERGRQVAERHGLRLWEVRALHKLGSIDLLTCAGRDRLVRARDGALRLGALATAAVVDLQLALSLGNRAALLDQALQAAVRCAEASRRLRLDSLLPLAVGVQADVLRLAGPARADGGRGDPRAGIGA
jgi:hypothetical protein